MPKPSSMPAKPKRTITVEVDLTAESDADRDALKRAAAILGKLGGLKGGPARAKKLSAKRRSEIARKAARGRWSAS